jgi:hypothetical protein
MIAVLIFLLLLSVGLNVFGFSALKKAFNTINKLEENSDEYDVLFHKIRTVVSTSYSNIHSIVSHPVIGEDPDVIRTARELRNIRDVLKELELKINSAIEQEE